MRSFLPLSHHERVGDGTWNFLIGTALLGGYVCYSIRLTSPHTVSLKSFGRSKQHHIEHPSVPALSPVPAAFDPVVRFESFTHCFSKSGSSAFCIAADSLFIFLPIFYSHMIRDPTPCPCFTGIEGCPFISIRRLFYFLQSRNG